MTESRYTIEIDPATDVRLRAIAAERGQDVSAVLADAVALLDAVASAGPDVSEDVRRLNDYRSTGLGVPLADVKAWVASWDSENELDRPAPRTIG